MKLIRFLVVQGTLLFWAIFEKFAYPTFIQCTGIPKWIGALQCRFKQIDNDSSTYRSAEILASFKHKLKTHLFITCRFNLLLSFVNIVMPSRSVFRCRLGTKLTTYCTVLYCSRNLVGFRPVTFSNLGVMKL